MQIGRAHGKYSQACHFCWSLPLLLFIHVIAAPIAVDDGDYTKLHGNMKIDEVEIQKTNQQIKKCMQRKQIINKGCMFFLEGGKRFVFQSGAFVLVFRYNLEQKPLLC